MAFVNRWISAEDRDKFNLHASDKWLIFANPSRDWVVDEDDATFLRILRPYARHNEVGDENAALERDFHFHWRNRDFLIFTRLGLDLEKFEGRQFGDFLNMGAKETPCSCYIRGIAEVAKGRFNARFGLDCNDEAFFRALRTALAEGNAGWFTTGSAHRTHKSMRVVMKIASRVEVSS